MVGLIGIFYVLFDVEFDHSSLIIYGTCMF